MGETEESTRNLVNASGFPFQIWLGNHIGQTSEQHGWRVLGSEVRWINERNGREEFADLVLAHQSLLIFRAVVEVKRVRDGVWIFLQTAQLPNKTRRFRYFWTCPNTIENTKLGWFDGYITQEELLVSSFCVVRGQAEERPLLERLASYILLATESVGKRELEIRKTGALIYLPIIVTTAKLVVHAFDAEAVEPLSGTLKESEFFEVPYILFQKSIGTIYTTSRRSRDLSDLNRQDERNVLIVNSLHVVEALRMLTTLKLKGDFENLPWREAF